LLGNPHGVATALRTVCINKLSMIAGKQKHCLKLKGQQIAGTSSQPFARMMYDPIREQGFIRSKGLH